MPWRMLRTNLPRQTASRAASALRRGARRVVAAACVAALSLQSLPAFAQTQGVVRDEEVESLLRDYAAPIFQAAGFRSGSIRIILVNDRSFNAFVADGRKLFMNVGAIMDAKTPNEIIGVLAHESG